VPKAVLAELRRLDRDNAVRNWHSTAALLKLLKLFESHHIPAIPLKGPALAALLYGDVSQRQFNDLDILVRERDLLAAGALLVSQGYTPDRKWTRAQEGGALQILHHFGFEPADDRAPVELHCRLVSWTRGLGFPLDPWWQQAILIPLMGTKRVRCFALEHLLLYLCVHGAHHQWERLCWVCDVAELIDVHPQLDWERTLEQAAQMGSERLLLLGLRLAGDLLGAQVPAHVQQQVKADARVSALARQVRSRLFGRRQSSHSQQIRFGQRLFGRWQEQVQYRWRILLFRYGVRWALEPPDGPFAALYPLLERVPSKNVWIWPLPLYALLFLASHPLYPMRRALERASPRKRVEP